jgi:Lysylphosphatidylglycerol synthase TM region
MSRRSRWWFAAAGLVLTVALFALARPGQVGELFRRARGQGLAVAFAWAALGVLVRGLRLTLLAGEPLTVRSGVAVWAVAQAAIALLPLRLGEVAWLPLLRGAGIGGAVRLLSLAVALRLVDIVALLAWACVAGVLLGRDVLIAALPLALLPLLAVVASIALTRWMRRGAPRWRLAGGWRRKALRQFLQARRELRRAARSPLRAGGALACSLAAWGAVWGLTVALLEAMDVTWPARHVLAGVIGAGVGASMPLNAVGSFGTLEAGWAAALTSLGHAGGQALATGFATHLWSLIFTSLLGGLGLAYLAVSHSGTSRR